MSEGKQKESLAALDSVKGKLGTDRHRRLRAFHEALLGLPIRDIKADGQLPLEPSVNLFKELVKLIVDSKTLPAGFNVPVAAWSQMRFSRVIKCVVAYLAVVSKLQDPEQAIKQIHEDCEDAPEPLQLIFLARLEQSEADVDSRQQPKSRVPQVS